jgi:hypothetical protein
MGWFRRRREAEEATLVATLTTALGTALSNVFANQTEQIKQSSAFLNQLQDLSARKAAQVLGSKGGRTTQKRKKAAQAVAAQQRECVLCRNPNHVNTTLEQINFHRQHEYLDQENPPQGASDPEVGN